MGQNCMFIMIPVNLNDSIFNRNRDAKNNENLIVQE